MREGKIVQLMPVPSHLRVWVRYKDGDDPEKGPVFDQEAVAIALYDNGETCVMVLDGELGRLEPWDSVVNEAVCYGRLREVRG